MAYTTLARVQAEIKGTEASKAIGTDQQLMGYIRTVTDRIRAFRYEFEPLYDTRRITPLPTDINSAMGLLSLGDYLLEPKTITVSGTSVTYGTDIVPYPNNGQTPIRTLRISDPRTAPINSWYGCYSGNSYIDSIVIAGFWGMREYYTSMGFFDSGNTCPALTATQVTMVVQDVDGVDAYGRTPIFSPGNLIRIDDELMEVIKAIGAATNTLTVIRGARGTTAATHTLGTAIQIWEPEEDIANCATRQAALLYARRGAYQQVTSLPDGINVTYPSDLLAEVRATVQRFNYLGVS